MDPQDTVTFSGSLFGTRCMLPEPFESAVEDVFLGCPPRKLPRRQRKAFNRQRPTKEMLVLPGREGKGETAGRAQALQH